MRANTTERLITTYNIQVKEMQLLEDHIDAMPFVRSNQVMQLRTLSRETNKIAKRLRTRGFINMMSDPQPGAAQPC